METSAQREEVRKGAMVAHRPVKMDLKLSPYGLTIWFNKQMRQFPAKRTAFVESLKLNRKGLLRTKREYRYGWTKK